MPSRAVTLDNLSLCLDTLKEILDQMQPDVHLETSLKSVLQVLSHNLGYVRNFLAIYDSETHSLKLSLTHGPQKPTQVSYGEGQGVTGQVLSTGEPIIVPVIGEHPEFLNWAFGRSKEEMASLAFVSVPVVHEEREGRGREILGVLSVDLPMAPMQVLQTHCRFLEVVARIIAHRVARLQEDMARQQHLMAQGLAIYDAGFSPKNIVHASKSMRLVLQQISQVAPSRATVLLRGESGTGKELLAEAIHMASPRAGKPLIRLNCAALPAELVESELFGHEKGAFTGAVQNKKGRFELAHQGTLFLDEIGELSLDAQAKVLRAIQEKEIQRLGSEQTIIVDTRLVCATNRQLEDLIAAGQFREDLFYRINVFPIYVQPLRERREDILPLAEHFLNTFSKEYGREIRRISTPALDLLTQYHWPGNARELRNCLERAVLLCTEEVIRTYHLPPTLQTAESSATDTDLSFGEAVAKFEQEIIVDALKKARGNMLQTARDLRISYRIVNYKIKKYGIDPKKFTTRPVAPQSK
ncbi:Nif-specific regulatory protein [Desulfonatronum thiosulfatophilum]|uniref:Nif-specific regulatory protein n=1 Tax=Desulfonatronum thiosulfatophilum TaxID=617002 RepID=A0A1G6BDX5_9BACT|nr:sigma 54-interacting transcriptional regulator [Desulfonatronum thiosulfatophilum]SDB18761.1 Nif-specific regulatory protein [Desulfonatronum thiosulfatophilum]